MVNTTRYDVLVTEQRPSRDEGAGQTALIVAAIKKLRAAKGWSARELAEEMTRVGVPWNPDIVTNLEHGKRKSLRVHEVIALAYVLDAETPLDLLVPVENPAGYPVTPNLAVIAESVRAWFLGETGPLRLALESNLRDERFGQLRAHARKLADSGQMSEAEAEALADDMVKLAISAALADRHEELHPRPKLPDGDGDGQS